MADMTGNQGPQRESHQHGGATQEFKDRARDLQRDVRGAMPELRERMNDVKEDVRALATTAGHAAMEQLDPVEDYVRRNPIRAILIASGVGIVLGMIMRR